MLRSALVGGVVVVFAELVDADRRLGRVADLVERDRTRDAVVVRRATVQDDLGAVRVRRAGLAVTGTAGDLDERLRHVCRIGRAGAERGEGEQDGRVEEIGRASCRERGCRYV